MPAGEKTKLLWQDPKYRKRMSLAHKGKKYPEHSKMMMGNKIAFRNRNIGTICPVCKKKFKSFVSENKKYCSKECWYNSNKFKKLAKQMIGNSFRKGLKPSYKVLKNLYRKSGKENWNWKGGITPLSNKIRISKKYIEWHKLVCKRDNWTCQSCGKKQGWNKILKKNINIEVHHIKEFCLIIENNNIKTLKQAVNCKELWDIDNGITLCKKCHNLTKYGKYTKIRPK